MQGSPYGATQIDATPGQRVRALLSIDDTGDGPRGRCDDYPRLPGGVQTNPFEDDMREWGLVYGMTWMLCRLQDPLETMESVSERALRAARTAWLDYSGEFEPVERQRHSDIFDVLDAWQACQQDARRFGEPELKVTDRLKYTLDGLAEATDGRES